jgi:hypothetical protein
MSGKVNGLQKMKASSMFLAPGHSHQENGDLSLTNIRKKICANSLKDPESIFSNASRKVIILVLEDLQQKTQPSLSILLTYRTAT